MNHSFYLTLHSDDPSISGLENHTSCFKVHLGHELHLDGQWEVGLAEIFYPMTMQILSREEGSVLVERKDMIKDEFWWSSSVVELDPKGLVYLDAYSLYTVLQKMFTDTGIEFNLIHDHYIQLSSTHHGARLQMSEKLKEVLGFSKSIMEFDSVIAGSRAINIKRAIPHQLFVSSDLIHNQMVGGTYDKLLRVVNVNHEEYLHGSMGSGKFERIHYYPVAQHKIDDVEVYIKDRRGKCISFESGTLTVVLHFRKISHD